MSVTANDLTLTGNALIESITAGNGDAGQVSVDADNLTITGHGAISTQSSQGSGNAGTVSVTANNLTVTGPNAQIDSGTFGSGDAGQVTVQATGTLRLEDSVISSSTAEGSSGDAGQVRVSANGLTLGPNSGITTTSSESGEAGKIILTGVSKLFMFDGASVTTQSGSGGGGDIEIRDAGMIVLRDGSRINVDTEAGAQAGDITIGSRFLVLDRSAISADALAGAGGDIRISSDSIFRSPDSEITARAGPASIAGTVVVMSPETDVTGGLVQLPDVVMNTAGQMQERCAVRGLVEDSSFTIAGLEAQSPALEGYLTGTYAAVADEDAAVTDDNLIALGCLASPAWTVACSEPR